MYGSNTTREILKAAVLSNNEARIANQPAKLLLRRKALDALDKVLIRISVASHELTDQRDGGKAPALVDGVEQRVRDLAELETGEDAAGLQDAVGLGEG